MRRALASALVAGLVFVAAGCGGDGDGYSAEVEETFMTECVPGAMESADGALSEDQAQDYCQCTYDDVKANVPFKEFEEYDTKSREDPATELPPEMTAVVERCAKSIR